MLNAINCIPGHIFPLDSTKGATVQGQESVHSALARNKTAAEFVFEQIQRDIVVGRLRPGQRLIERELTERFQISRTPVREALQRLVRTQLAVNIAYRGVVVRSLSLEHARNLYDLRRGIEGIAAYLAAARATEAELNDITDVYDQIHALTQEGQRDEVMLMNNQFHRAIAEASHNELLVERIDDLWTHVNLVRSRAWRDNRRTESSRREHEVILRALVERQPEAAREAVEHHVQRSWSVVEASMSEADEASSDGEAAAKWGSR